MNLPNHIEENKNHLETIFQEYLNQEETFFPVIKGDLVRTDEKQGSSAVKSKIQGVKIKAVTINEEVIEVASVMYPCPYCRRTHWVDIPVKLITGSSNLVSAELPSEAVTCGRGRALIEVDKNFTVRHVYHMPNNDWVYDLNAINVVRKNPKEIVLENPKENVSEKSQDNLLKDFKILEVEKQLGRRVCPKCGNFNKFSIHELYDKSILLSITPRIYGKKYQCRLCNCFWRETQRLLRIRGDIVDSF